MVRFALHGRQLRSWEGGGPLLRLLILAFCFGELVRLWRAAVRPYAFGFSFTWATCSVMGGGPLARLLMAFGSGKELDRSC